MDSIIVKKDGSKHVSNFSNEALAKIDNFMPKINRSMKVFGRNNTQTTNKMMTLTMLNGIGSPYRLLRQAMTEIDNKVSAIRVNVYRLKKSEIKNERMKNELITEKDPYKSKLLSLKIDEFESGITRASLNIDGALKDIASFQDAYEQIRIANNIPEDWDEKDMEEAEPRFHLRQAFQLIYRDLVSMGRPNVATLEYLAQFGVHGQTAETLTRNYIETCNNMIKEGRFPSNENFEQHLDHMCDLFKDAYNESLDRMGITNHVTEFAQFEDETRKADRLEHKKDI